MITRQLSQSISLSVLIGWLRERVMAFGNEQNEHRIQQALCERLELKDLTCWQIDQSH